MVTRDEVARRAGTSTAVVSYVMNNGPRNVSEATRRRVLAAVADLGYRPNAVARSLRASSSAVLGLVVPDITNAYCGELALAVEDAALARGYTLLLGNSMHDDRRQASHIQTFLSHQVRGIVFIGSTYGDEDYGPETRGALELSEAPLVFLDRPTCEFGTAISVDNRAAAFDATTHILGHGYPSVANFAGSPGLSAVRERKQGWADALEAHGLDPESQQVYASAFDRHDAFRVATAMFAAPGRPRAIFCHSDEQSIGILHAAAKASLRVPEDVALVSFDGIKEAGLVFPGLTTVAQPIRQSAAAAVDILVEGEHTEGPRARKELPLHLVIRHSCGC